MGLLRLHRLRSCCARRQNSRSLTASSAGNSRESIRHPPTAGSRRSHPWRNNPGWPHGGLGQLPPLAIHTIQETRTPNRHGFCARWMHPTHEAGANPWRQPWPPRLWRHRHASTAPPIQPLPSVPLWRQGFSAQPGQCSPASHRASRPNVRGFASPWCRPRHR